MLLLLAADDGGVPALPGRTTPRLRILTATWSSPPSWKDWQRAPPHGGLQLLLATRGVQLGISQRGPGWLNLVVVLLAWDADEARMPHGSVFSCAALLESFTVASTRVCDRPSVGFGRIVPCLTISRCSVMTRWPPRLN